MGAVRDGEDKVAALRRHEGEVTPVESFVESHAGAEAVRRRNVETCLLGGVAHDARSFVLGVSNCIQMRLQCADSAFGF